MNAATHVTYEKYPRITSVTVKLISGICLILASFNLIGNAGEPKIYQQDVMGNIQ